MCSLSTWGEAIAPAVVSRTRRTFPRACCHPLVPCYKALHRRTTETPKLFCSYCYACWTIAFIDHRKEDWSSGGIQSNINELWWISLNTMSELRNRKEGDGAAPGKWHAAMLGLGVCTHMPLNVFWIAEEVYAAWECTPCHSDTIYKLRGSMPRLQFCWCFETCTVLSTVAAGACCTCRFRSSVENPTSSALCTLRTG